VYGKDSMKGPTDGLMSVAMSELLEAFRAGNGVDWIRESVRMVCRS